MNKYQEALDRFKLEENWQEGNEFDILQELIDKETPIKLEKGLMSKYCGKCKSGVWCSHNISWESKYCSNCGQKIDWSDKK